MGELTPGETMAAGNDGTCGLATIGTALLFTWGAMVAGSEPKTGSGDVGAGTSIVGFKPLPTVVSNLELVIFDDSGAVMIGTFGNVLEPVGPATIGTRRPLSAGTIAGLAGTLTMGAGNGEAAVPVRSGRRGLDDVDDRGTSGLANGTVGS